MRTSLYLALSLCFFISLSSVFAAPRSCDIDSTGGDTCTVSVTDLYPTQLTYGSIEVERRSTKFSGLSSSELQKYLKKNTVPVVIGPDGHVFVTDHHHLALALVKATGKDATVIAEVQSNWSTEAESSFWSKMQDAEYLYLFDENGKGPKPLAALPTSLFDLKDDPYRSLAWGVRKNNGYMDSTIPHADFLWANFFRSRIDRKLLQKDFDKAVKQGTGLATSDEAKNLPGYGSQP